MLMALTKHAKPTETANALRHARRPLAVRTAVRTGKDCRDCGDCMWWCAVLKGDCGNLCREKCAGSPPASGD